MIQTTLWDGSIVNSEIDIEDAPANYSSLIMQNVMPIRSISHFHITEVQNSSEIILEANNYYYLLILQNNKVIINYLTSMAHF